MREKGEKGLGRKGIVKTKRKYNVHGMQVE